MVWLCGKLLAGLKPKLSTYFNSIGQGKTAALRCCERKKEDTGGWHPPSCQFPGTELQMGGRLVFVFLVRVNKREECLN